MKRERITERMIVAARDEKEKKQRNGEIRRELDGFEYDKAKAKTLKDVLHNINVSLGTLIAAMKQLAMLRGSEITPDGRIGGRGFIMDFKDVKSILSESIRNLSDVTDSIADELTNPKWGLKDKEVNKVEKEQEELEDKVEEAEEVSDKAETTKPEDQLVVENQKTKEGPESEDKSLEEKSEIGPDDVKNSSMLNRYQDLIGNGKDKTASILSKHILANIISNKGA